MPDTRRLILFVIYLALSLGLIFLFSTTFKLLFSTANAASANFSHSYNATENINTGSIVSFVKGQSSFVELANSDNGNRLVGVAVSSNDSLLAADASNSKVQVAINGIASTLASTVNGDIKVGDQIAVSPFAGIGVKSPPGSYVIGQAQSSLSDNTNGVAQQELTDRNGRSSKITIGYIRLQIAVGYFSTNSSPSLNSLQKVFKSITGRTASTLRVAISLLVIVVTLIALIALIYASVYGGIISVGRNPLAKSDIFRTLMMVLLLAVMLVASCSVTLLFLLG